MSNVNPFTIKLSASTLSQCQPLMFMGTFAVSTSCVVGTFTGLQRTRICILADPCHCSDWHLAVSWWAFTFFHRFIFFYTSLIFHILLSRPRPSCYIINHIRSQPHCLQGNLINWPSATFLFIYCFAVFRKGSQEAFSQKKRPNSKRTFSGLTWSLECEYARDMTDPQPGLTNPSLRLTTTSWVWHSAMLTSWQDTKNQKPFIIMLLTLGLGQSQY